MREHVRVPNLPVNAETVLAGKRYAKLLAEPLKNCGVHVLWVPDNDRVDPRLRGHADLSVFHAGGKKIFLASQLKDSELCKELAGLGFDVSYPDIMQDKSYPLDAQLNICIIGKHYLCRKDIVPFEIKEFLDNDRKLECIDCRQGYSRCSVCVADENSIITSDAGIAAAAEKNGIDVLKIRESHVLLEGYPYGFIGGACFKSAEDVLLFTGSLDGHPDKDRMENFLLMRGITPKYLTDLPAFDVGGIIPISEAITNI